MVDKKPNRLLSSVLLLLAVSSACGVVAMLMQRDDNLVGAVALGVGAMLVGVAFVVSKTRHHQKATPMAVVALSVPSYIVFVASAGTNVHDVVFSLAWLAIPMMLSTLGMSVRGAIFVNAGNVVATSLLPAVVPGAEYAVVGEALGFVISVGFLNMGVAVLRRRDQQAVDAHIRDLESTRGELQRAKRDLEARVEQRTGDLRASNETLGALVASSPAAVLVQTVDGEVSIWNPAAGRIFGWGEGEVVGEQNPLVAMQSYLNGDELVIDRECEIEDKSGQVVSVSLSVAPLHGQAHEVVGHIAILIDTTERKQLEDQLRHAQKMEAIGTLAGGVAHEMNNILAVVLGLASVLEGEIDANDRRSQDVREILAAARRGKSLTENLLDFARRGAYARGVVSLNEVVRTLVQVLGRTVSKKITVDAVLDSELACVRCDVDQITQVLMNLCVNAVDAMGDGGSLTITTSNVVVAEGGKEGALPAGDYVCVEVSDDGAGMEKAVADRAFEPFFTTKDVGEGTGLGLSIAYGAVLEHDGDISLESEPGAGTTVTIQLPVAEASEQPAEMDDSTNGIQCGAGTVLLVDDEKMIRMLGTRVLETLGYDVMVADGGEAAVETYRDRHREIDLVLLDMSMPVMDGAECYERLLVINPSCQVLVCTGGAKSEAAEALLAKGALGVVKKPFDIQRLGAALATAIQN